MSRFLPLVSKTYEFQGDKVAVSFSHLTREQMIKIMPHIPQDGKVSQDDLVKNTEMVDVTISHIPQDGKVSQDDLVKNMEMVDVTISALKQNMKSLTGLLDAEGRPLTWEATIDEAYFTNLYSEIAFDLISESMVNEKKPSNSQDPSTA